MSNTLRDNEPPATRPDEVPARVARPAQSRDAAPGSEGNGRSRLFDVQRPHRRSIEDEEICLDIRDLSVYYGTSQALFGINLRIPRNRITAFIGPSGCGKSTLLRCFNRMNELSPQVRTRGQVLMDGEDIYAPEVDVTTLRRRVGMVFQKPNPFPKSVYENVAYGLRISGVRRRSVLDETVRESLKAAALWDEVRDRLRDSALGLSGGQQQRLVIARAIATQPEVLLLDEPASALDPISTLKIESLLTLLKERYTIVIVTHNMQQAARVSDYTAFLYVGEVVEFADTDTLFTKPGQKRTENYITGRFG